MTPEVQRIASSLASSRRFLSFISVGATGALLDTASVVVLTMQFGIYRGTAKIIGAELAIVLMFVINEHWTFAGEGGRGVRPFLGRLLRSNVVRLGGLAVGTVVFIIVSGFELRLPVGGESLWIALANIFSIAVGSVVNYVFESLVTWRVHRPVSE